MFSQQKIFNSIVDEKILLCPFVEITELYSENDENEVKIYTFDAHNGRKVVLVRLIQLGKFAVVNWGSEYLANIHDYKF